MTIADDIEALVRRRAGWTEIELAAKLFPDGPYQQRVNSISNRRHEPDLRIVFDAMQQAWLCLKVPK